MKKLANKRARLRAELLDAHAAWLRVAQPMDTIGERPVDIRGVPRPATPQWLAYLAAKKRLVEAYAELPVTA